MIWSKLRSQLLTPERLREKAGLRSLLVIERNLYRMQRHQLGYAFHRCHFFRGAVTPRSRHAAFSLNRSLSESDVCWRLGRYSQLLQPTAATSRFPLTNRAFTRRHAISVYYGSALNRTSTNTHRFQSPQTAAVTDLEHPLHPVGLTGFVSLASSYRGLLRWLQSTTSRPMPSTRRRRFM